MIADHDLQALLQARHPDPFSVLGLHADAQGRLWVRALLPGAVQAEVVDAVTRRRVAALAMRDAAGFFEGVLPGRRRRFDYRLRVRWGEGAPVVLDDPYRHGPLLADADLHYLAEGTHLRPFEVLGAHPLRLGEDAHAVEGVRFAVWAPNASRVAVVGDFNAWDGRRHPMRHRGASGVWELFVPHAARGDHYRYEIRAADGRVLPLKSDPYARAAQVRPESASVVAGRPGGRRPTRVTRRCRSTKSTPAPGGAAPMVASSTGMRWPRRCRPTPRAWVSPTSNCCR
jgi:1,4-alpha-glucan branching enzyme